MELKFPPQPRNLRLECSLCSVIMHYYIIAKEHQVCQFDHVSILDQIIMYHVHHIIRYLGFADAK